MATFRINGALSPALSLLFMVLLPAMSCRAVDHIVFVGDGFPPNHIVPSDLTITVGDTVTFKAGGNIESHNVHADDESFRCSLGCRGDGTGATGNPSRQNWSDTLVFNSKGRVTYKCDTHPSATGSITINDIASGPPIAGGFSGNWFNPQANQGGHGFQIEVLPNNGMIAIWFVFNPAGSAQSWIFAQGAYTTGSNTAVLPAVLEQGGAFPPNFDSTKLAVPAWGALQFTFTDCNTGTASWTASDAARSAGYNDITFPIQRLTSIAGMPCP